MNTSSAAVAIAIATVLPATAFAQPQDAGPMTIERIHSGPLVAADAKVTEIDHHTSELVGGQGGWVVDDTIFIGGAGYWLANGTRDRRMAYGGFVVQWFGRSDARFGYGVRGLVGGGQATLADTISVPVFVTRAAGRFAPQLRPTTFRVRRDFFLAEPEANAFVRLNRRLRLVGGVGYRFVGVDGRDDDRLRGATGSLGIQVS
jgi:hypothetical protein